MPDGMEHVLATAPAVATSMPIGTDVARLPPCGEYDILTGHRGTLACSAGVAGRVAAPLRMYEAHAAMQNRRSQGLRLSCGEL
jgi:hypothetical protein